MSNQLRLIELKRNLGLKSFELSNHLGNVLVTVSDKKVYTIVGSDIVFEPEITTISDYNPFGSSIAIRSYSSGAYRYGFNGKELDDENFEGAIAFEARIYDSRLGKFLSVDSRMSEYAWQTPYAYYKNCLISILDIAGMGGPFQEDDEVLGIGWTDASTSSSAQGAGTPSSGANTSSNNSASPGTDVCGPPKPQILSDASNSTLNTFSIGFNVGETDWLMSEKDCWWNNGGPKQSTILDHAPINKIDCYDYSSFKSPVKYLAFEIDIVQNNGIFSATTLGVPTETGENKGNHTSQIGGTAYLIPVPGTTNEFYFKGVLQVLTSSEGITLGASAGPVSAEKTIGNSPSGTLYSVFSCKITVSVVNNIIQMNVSETKISITPNGIKMDDDEKYWGTGDVYNLEW